VEDFDRAKLLASVRVACAKRPVSGSAMEELVDGIEDALSRQAGVEVPAVEVGELVMEALSPLDRVAYVRYASVYRNFQDAGEFQEFVDEMTARQKREVLRRNQVEFPF
jgi:transcriptional repressor NrdR